MKLSTMFKTSLFLVAATAMVGCASGRTEAELNTQLKEITPQQTREDLSKRVEQTILSANITQDQRNALLGLRERTHKELAALRDESYRLRAVLISDTIRPDYRPDDIDAVKTRLRKVENNRLAVVFNAVDEAHKILGHKSEENRPVIKSFESSLIFRD